MLKTVKTYSCLAVVCALAVLPIGVFAGGTPEDVKAFKENKAKAEAGEGFINYWDGQANGPLLDYSGKPASENNITPGALVANAYLSGVGVDRDESEALLWYFRVKGQKGLNEEAFKVLIRSMPSERLYAAILRTDSNQFINLLGSKDGQNLDIDQTFIPLGRLKASSHESIRDFNGFGFSDFIGGAAQIYSTRLLLAEPSYPLGSLTNELDNLDHKSFSAKIAFSQTVTGSDKSIFESASARVRGKIDALIANPASADSSGGPYIVAKAYAKGLYGLKADPEQSKRWANLNREARISEAKRLRAEAESSGSDLWLEIANDSKWTSSSEEKEILGDFGFWSFRYTRVLGLKAEAGDRASIDGLIAHLGQLVRETGGIRTSQWSPELIKWISARHKLTRSPEDAIILAHHNAASADKNLARQLVNQYLEDMVLKAKRGSLSDILKLALLADPNWFEKLEGDIGSYTTGEIRQIYSHAPADGFHSFREHGRLLKSFDYVGNNITYRLEEPAVGSPFSAKRMTSRSIFIRYVEGFAKRESSGQLLVDEFGDFDHLATVVRYLAEQDKLVADQYHEVSGGTPDFNVQLRWYRLLAEMGDLEALSFIADSFEKGQGVPRDPASAYAYHALSGEGPGYRNDNPLQEIYRKTKGTNEQKLDACFKLSSDEKKKALKVYEDFVAKLTNRLEKLASKGGAERAQRTLQGIRDFEKEKAANAQKRKK